MDEKTLTHLKTYTTLKSLSNEFSRDSFHLKHLLNESDRLKRFSCSLPGFFYDFSRQRVNMSTMDALYHLAVETGARKKFAQMNCGDKINTTEDRAALHTATRATGPEPVHVDGKNVLPLLKKENERVAKFTEKVRSKKITGTTNKAFTDAVVVGIGGSYLGCQFVYEALKRTINPLIRLHFLSNVDIDNFGEIIKNIEAETCLWIIISKSFTTTETMANQNQVKGFLKQHGLEESDHLVTITAKGSPGDIKGGPVSFKMFDFIGGRYSVTSAVGALPLSLAFGFPAFTQFLNGCRNMDQHAQNSRAEENIPLTAALIGIWNSIFLNYCAQAIIPYCSALEKLAPHVQQLNMESLGKGVTAKGQVIDYNTGMIIFGEPGTNAQHSFFQLAHQGRPFPIEFIGVINPVYEGRRSKLNGVDNHQELWANMIAQAQALAVGRENENKARHFNGNRPSSTILIEEISPESIGLLLSFYEAKTVFEGFILGINPFDQFGVELGKKLASGVRRHIADKNNDVSAEISTQNPITDFYLEVLFKGSL